MKKILLGLLILIVLIVGTVVVLIQVPKKVEVEWSEADFKSYLEKGDINYVPETAASIDDMLTGNYEVIGVSEVDTFVSNEEITAMINMTTKDTGLFQDVNMKFIGDDRMEVSATIGESIDTIIEKYPEVEKYERYLNSAKGKSVYMRTTLKNVDSNEFEAHVESLRIGNLPLPEGEVNKNMLEVGSMANNLMGRLEGFTVEEFKITTEGIHFKGTIPKEIRTLELD